MWVVLFTITATTLLRVTVGRESQLSADHRGILIVPEVITHSSIPPSNADFYSASQKSIFVIVVFIIGGFSQEVLIAFPNQQPQITIKAYS